MEIKKIFNLIRENKQIKEENQAIKSEALDLEHKLNNIKRIIFNGETRKENYFSILNKIKSELDITTTH